MTEASYHMLSVTTHLSFFNRLAVADYMLSRAR